VLGVAGLIAPITVDSVVLRREAPIAAAAAILFGFFLQNGLARWEGIVLLVGLLVAVAYIVLDARRAGSGELDAEVDEYLDEDEPLSTRKEVVRTILGLIGTVAGAQVLVYGATGIAEEIGLGEGFIGLTLVAVGTSLPELTTAIAAARKREHDLVVGNVLGSNMFNALAVGAVAALVGPGRVEDHTLEGLAVALMVGIALMTWAMTSRGQRLVRVEAGALVLAYAVTVPLLAT
jgi:cation:H+ antiporter